MRRVVSTLTDGWDLIGRLGRAVTNAASYKEAGREALSEAAIPHEDETMTMVEEPT